MGSATFEEVKRKFEERDKKKKLKAEKKRQLQEEAKRRLQEEEDRARLQNNGATQIPSPAVQPQTPRGDDVATVSKGQPPSTPQQHSQHRVANSTEADVIRSPSKVMKTNTGRRMTTANGEGGENSEEEQQDIVMNESDNNTAKLQQVPQSPQQQQRQLFHSPRTPQKKSGTPHEQVHKKLEDKFQEQLTQLNKSWMKSYEQSEAELKKVVSREVAEAKREVEQQVLGQAEECRRWKSRTERLEGLIEQLQEQSEIDRNEAKMAMALTENLSKSLQETRAEVQQITHTSQKQVKDLCAQIQKCSKDIGDAMVEVSNTVRNVDDHKNKAYAAHEELKQKLQNIEFQISGLDSRLVGVEASWNRNQQLTRELTQNPGNEIRILTDRVMEFDSKIEQLRATVQHTKDKLKKHKDIYDDDRGRDIEVQADVLASLQCVEDKLSHNQATVQQLILNVEDAKGQCTDNKESLEEQLGRQDIVVEGVRQKLAQLEDLVDNKAGVRICHANDGSGSVDRTGACSVRNDGNSKPNGNSNSSSSSSSNNNNNSGGNTNNDRNGGGDKNNNHKKDSNDQGDGDGNNKRSDSGNRNGGGGGSSGGVPNGTPGGNGGGSGGGGGGSPGGHGGDDDSDDHARKHDRWPIDRITLKAAAPTKGNFQYLDFTTPHPLDDDRTLETHGHEPFDEDVWKNKDGKGFSDHDDLTWPVPIRLREAFEKLDRQKVILDQFKRDKDKHSKDRYVKSYTDKVTIRHFAGDGNKFADWAVSTVDACYKLVMADQQNIFIQKVLEEHCSKEVKFRAEKESIWKTAKLEDFICWLATGYARPVPPEVEAERARGWKISKIFSYAEVVNSLRYLFQGVKRANVLTVTITETEVVKLVKSQLPSSWKDYHDAVEREVIRRNSTHGYLASANRLILWVLNVLKDLESLHLRKTNDAFGSKFTSQQIYDTTQPRGRTTYRNDSWKRTQSAAVQAVDSSSGKPSTSNNNRSHSAGGSGGNTSGGNNNSNGGGRGNTSSRGGRGGYGRGNNNGGGRGNNGGRGNGGPRSYSNGGSSGGSSGGNNTGGNSGGSASGSGAQGGQGNSFGGRGRGGGRGGDRSHSAGRGGGRGRAGYRSPSPK